MVSEYYRRFCAQKGSSKQRGIPFRLTFDEWLEIWSESGHLKDRGLYCMSRKNDEGAYEVGNVFIQTIANNSRDASIKCATAWTDEETKKSIEMFVSGTNLTEISSSINRSKEATRLKIYRNLSLAVWQNTISQFPSVLD